MSGKPCTTCRWAFQTRFPVYSAAVCLSPNNADVSGFGMRIPNCRDQRKNICGEQTCGVSGQWWEPKPRSLIKRILAFIGGRHAD